MRSNPAFPRTGRALFAASWVLPIVLLLAWMVAPLMSGSATLYLRDVLHTHFEMKLAYAEGLREGALPLVDLHRAGGQPLLGNPNTVPLYPDNLLYLVAPPLWALNAHFWIHLLLAPFTFFWMGRAWGLGREGAWAAGVCYATSGYVLSNLAFYNLIAGVTLAPALAAACLEFCGVRRRRMSGPVVAIVWALLILAGDPFLALLAFLLAVAAALAKHGVHPRRLLGLAAAFLCGTLIAAPQIVGFLGIVGSSFRAQLGYSVESRTLASWDPRQIVEWFAPFAFGRPDRIGPAAFWGHRFFTGRPPYYLSLYPGLLTLALVTASLRARGRARAFGIGAAAAGLLVALGRFNPAAAWIFEGSGGILRYPIRFWLAVAMGGALLAGIGFEGAITGRDPRRARALRAALAVLLAAFAIAAAVLLLSGGPIEEAIRGAMPAGRGAEAAASERARHAAMALAALPILALFLVLARQARRRPLAAGAALLIAHCGVQVVLLAPLFSNDEVEAYLTPPPALASVPRGSTVVHGEAVGLRGSPGEARRVYPDARGFWPGRRAVVELQPPAGPLWDLRHELSVSSDGVDSFLAHAARDAARLSDDDDLLRLLEAWGVEYLLLDRDLTGDAAARVEPSGTYEGFGGTLRVYRLLDPAPPVAFAGAVLRAPHLNAAVNAITRPDFDPSRMTVIPGEGAPQRGAGGEARLVSIDRERIVAEVAARSPGVLVVQRAHVPILRATVDGREVPILIANLHRIGVRVPEGEHRVEIRTDRRPLTRSLWIALAGLIGCAAMTRPGRPAA